MYYFSKKQFIFYYIIPINIIINHHHSHHHHDQLSNCPLNIQKQSLVDPEDQDLIALFDQYFEDEEI